MLQGFYIHFALFCKSFLIFQLDKLLKTIFIYEFVRFCPNEFSQFSPEFFTKLQNAWHLIDRDSFFRHFTLVFVSFRKRWILNIEFCDRPVSADKVEDPFSWDSINTDIWSVDLDFLVSESKSEANECVHISIKFRTQTKILDLNVLWTSFDCVFIRPDCTE